MARCPRCPAVATNNVVGARESIQVVPADGEGCVLLRPRAELAEVPLPCGGRLTLDGEGYYQGQTWVALDGSATVEHIQKDEYAMTPFGSVIHLERSGPQIKLWTTPIDAPYAAADPSKQLVIDCHPSTMAACDSIEALQWWPTGVCVLTLNSNSGQVSAPDPGPIVFDCADATRHRTLDATSFSGTEYTRSAIEEDEASFLDERNTGTTMDGFEARLTPNAFIVTSDLEVHWVTDDRVFETAPRTSDAGNSYHNTVAVGYDGTLYRHD